VVRTGDGFYQSSGGIYGAELLATRGEVVVVSFNYRLAALGFLAHPGSGPQLSCCTGSFGDSTTWGTPATWTSSLAGSRLCWSTPGALPAAGSRRAATGAGRDPQRGRQTVMDRDHRFRPVRPPTWRLSQDFTTLNSRNLQPEHPRADLARKQSGFDQLAGERVPVGEHASWPRLGR
jgi:Carboxylesterase family